MTSLIVVDIKRLIDGKDVFRLEASTTRDIDQPDLESTADPTRLTDPLRITVIY